MARGGEAHRKSAGTCPYCGKQRYVTRADARRIAKDVHHDQMSAYECRYALDAGIPDFWHIGHLHPAVKRGDGHR